MLFLYIYIHVLSRIGHYWPAAPVARLKNTYHITLHSRVLVLESLHSLCTRGLETASVKYLLNIFTADAKMAVVETLWQLHTLIVINSWLTKQSSCHVSVGATIGQEL